MVLPFWQEVAGQVDSKIHGTTRGQNRRTTRAAQVPKDMAPPLRNTTTLASLERGLDYLKNQGGADIELVLGVGT